MAAYELTTAIMNNGAIDTAIALAKGIGDLPTNIVERLNSADPAVRGEALVNALSIGGVATVITGKLGQLGYTVIVKQAEASAAKIAEAQAIAKAKIDNNVYAEGASSQPVGLQTSAGVIPANPNKTTTVLGRYTPDMESAIGLQMNAAESTNFGASPGGFNVLNVDKVTEVGAGSLFFEKVNKPFLDAALKRGDDVALATMPKLKSEIIDIDTGALKGNFAKELNYLVKNNYRPVNMSKNQWEIVKTWFK